MPELAAFAVGYFVGQGVLAIILAAVEVRRARAERRAEAEASQGLQQLLDSLQRPREG